MKVSPWIILVPLVLGMSMSLLVKDNVDRVCGVRSSLTPPPYVFGIVWPVLYLIIGYTYYQYLNGVGNRGIWSRGSIFMMVSFVVLNLWYVLFGNYCDPAHSFVSLFLITLLYIVITYMLWKAKVVMWYLMILLLAWLSFATLLTYQTIPVEESYLEHKKNKSSKKKGGKKKNTNKQKAAEAAMAKTTDTVAKTNAMAKEAADANRKEAQVKCGVAGAPTPTSQSLMAEAPDQVALDSGSYIQDSEEIDEKVDEEEAE